MATVLDPQVQIRLIDIAWKKAEVQMKPGQTLDELFEAFDKMYKLLVKSVS